MPKPCDCPRVHRTVGRENLTVVFGGSSAALQYPLGGEWYSHPALGECKEGKPLGTDGCSWKGTVTKAINATCLYGLIDAEVESLAPACFSGCPQGTTNRSAPCYLRCFENVTL